MLKKKSSGGEKKRKHSQSEERHDNSGRRSTGANVEVNSKDECADRELDRIGSDIEEGGLDLNLPFQPITAYVADKKEMLRQCLLVLGEKKLRKMLPDELKDFSLEEIKNLCWEQLEPISDRNIFQILAGEELTSRNRDDNTEETMESQQDSNVDSTSCIKTEDPKQEVGGSGEESDVLSINADTYDSDIEGPKEEQAVKALKLQGSSRDAADPPVNPDPADPPKPPPADSKPAKAKKDIQIDIDKSVSEILAISSTSSEEAAKEESAPPQTADVSLPVQARPVSSGAPAASQPSIQQLELLELEMRARAIKALMKASDGKKVSSVKNV